MKYRTIVADPPWPYRWAGDNSPSRGFGAVNYPTMGILEIAELNVGPRFAENDAHLYLWVTADFHRRGEGSRIVQWWGFDVVGEFVWRKSLGMGRFPRLSHEFLLVGRRGNLPFEAGLDTHSVQDWPRSAVHSQKPDAAFDLIERASPGPYLELFARRQRLGWDTWGNEALCHVEMNVA